MLGPGARRQWAACLLSVVLLQSTPLSAQQNGGAGLGGPGAIDLYSAIETQFLDSVAVELRGVTGDAERNSAFLSAARETLGLRAGDRLTAASIEAGLDRVRRLEGVAEAEIGFFPVVGGGMRVRAVMAITVGETAVEPTTPTGAFAGEGFAGLPSLWRGEGGGLRLILNGGQGVFSDGNPWFGNAPAFTTGNPLVQDPSIGADTGSRATWAEAWIEFGLGGATRLGDSNYAIYGAATAIGVAARGQDIFRDDPRQTLDWEKAYVGLLWGSEDRSRSVNVSLGRQNFSLNDGFLISQFGSQWNAGPRPGVYLAPRTTHDFAALGTVKLDAWTATAFYLDPNEYEPLETDTRLAGLNLRYNFTEQFYADASVINVPESETPYGSPSGPVGTRAGLRTWAGHVRWADRERAPGFWAEAELAHQTHSDFDMSAWAGYGTVGYLARGLPWTPSRSYRYSAFSGDDPATATYERFDALYSGGLSEWLQGISIGKLVRPDNRLSHRIRLNVAPTERLDLTADWFMHRADELNNIGASPAIAQLSSRDLGQELTLTGRWAICDRLYFLGIAGAAFPGNAIKDAAGGDAEPWTTLQAQLFWNF